MADRVMKSGDTWPPLIGTLQQVSGDPLDLTGAASVHMWMRSDTLAIHTDECEIIDPIAGIVSYQLSPEESAVPGTYKIEWEVDWGDDEDDRPRIQTFPHDRYEELELMPELDPTDGP